MYTFTLFCRFEQKVYVAQWLTSKTFNLSLLVMRGFNTHQRRHFFTLFQFCFRHFLQCACDSICMLLQVQVSVSMRKPFFFLLYVVYMSFTLILFVHLLYSLYIVPVQTEEMGLCSTVRYSAAIFAFLYLLQYQN